MARKRKIPHLIYVSEEEELKIRTNMALLGMNNFSTYSRKMLTEGKVAHIDFSEAKGLNKNLAMIGNNINQIARKVNIEDEASKNNIDALLSEWEEFKKYYSEMIKKFIAKSKFD